MLDLPVDIKKVLQSDSLPDYQYLFDVLIQVTSVLDKEKGVVPYIITSRKGDFTAKLDELGYNYSIMNF